MADQELALFGSAWAMSSARQRRRSPGTFQDASVVRAVDGGLQEMEEELEKIRPQGRFCGKAPGQEPLPAPSHTDYAASHLCGLRSRCSVQLDAIEAGSNIATS